MISEIEIKDALYAMLVDSPLVGAVSGRLYKDSRPKNSVKEDVVISISSSMVGQIQRFRANVNIYVPDSRREEEYIENTKRLRVLSALAAETLEHFGNGAFQLDMESQRCIDVEDINFHCINNRLKIRAVNFFTK